MRIDVRLITYLVFVFGVGCQANPIDTKTPLERISTPLAPPTQGAMAQMTPSLSSSISPDLESLIEKAKEDLAQRLSISTTEISLVESIAVEWSDSSLGCPQQGMFYLQVITPGYLIRLQALDRVFEFHTNKGDQIIYCDNPSAPLPGARPDR